MCDDAPVQLRCFMPCGVAWCFVGILLQTALSHTIFFVTVPQGPTATVVVSSWSGCLTPCASSERCYICVAPASLLHCSCSIIVGQVARVDPWQRKQLRTVFLKDAPDEETLHRYSVMALGKFCLLASVFLCLWMLLLLSVSCVCNHSNMLHRYTA